VARKAGMIHVVTDNARSFGTLAAELMPDIEVVHFVDGGLPSMTAEAQRPRVVERLRTLASFAQESGAEAILLTCTAFGRLVDDVQSAVTCPVLSVLEIMVDEALTLPGAIGIIGSHPGTLETASRMLGEQACLEGRDIDVTTRLCPGAFDAMRRDDWATHNRIVLSALQELAQQVDVVLAPQPSIERAVLEFADSHPGVLILTSPRLSVLRLKQALDALP
jgi:hypothetical protein